MKEKNTIIGTVLLGILFAGMFWYTNTLPKPKKDAKKTEALATTAKTDSTIAPNDSTKTYKLTKEEFANIEVAGFKLAKEEKTHVLENEKLKVTFSNFGGRIASVEIKDYKTWDKKPLILFTKESNQFQYLITNEGGTIKSNLLPFDVSQIGNTISYKAVASNGATIEQIYSLSDEDYKVDYELKLNGITQPITLDWKSHLLSLEHNVQTERNYSALYYKYKGSDVNHLDETKTEDEAKAESDVQWISFKQQFSTQHC